MKRTFFALIAFLSLALCGSARANAFERIVIYHRVPERAVIYMPPPVVAYDADDRFAGGYALQGVVTYSAPFHMTVRVRDDSYAVDLRQGTVIKPVGITLTPSMVVNVAGYWSGGTFVANRIVVLRY